MTANAPVKLSLVYHQVPLQLSSCAHAAAVGVVSASTCIADCSQNLMLSNRQTRPDAMLHIDSHDYL